MLQIGSHQYSQIRHDGSGQSFHGFGPATANSFSKMIEMPVNNGYDRLFQ